MEQIFIKKNISVARLYTLSPYSVISIITSAKLLNLGYSSLSGMITKGEYHIPRTGKGYSVETLIDCLENGIIRIKDNNRGWFVSQATKATFTTLKPEYIKEMIIRHHKVIPTPEEESRQQNFDNALKVTPILHSKVSVAPVEMNFKRMVVIDPVTRETWPFEDVMFKVLERAMD